MLRNQVSHFKVFGLIAGNHGAPWVAELLFQFDGVFANDVEHQALISKDCLQAIDLINKLGEFRSQLLDFQTGELNQTQCTDRLSLHAREPCSVWFRLGNHRVGNLRRIRMCARDAECALHQSGDRFFAGACRADDADDFVDVADCVDQTLKAVRLLLRLAKQERRASTDDFLAMRDVQINQVAQGQRAWLAVDKRNVDDGEGVLQRSELIELLLHHCGVGVLLQHHHDARLRVAAGVILDVGDFRNAIVPACIHDLFDQIRLHHLVGDFVDDDRVARAVLLQMHLAAHSHLAAASGVGLCNATSPHDHAAGWEVWANDVLHQLIEANGWIINDRNDGVAYFAHVVRRHAAGHTHGDAARAVDEQVGELRREHGWLLQAVVVVGLEVDGSLVEILKQRDSGGGHARFGVTHGGWWVAFDRSEVSLLVDQECAGLPGLAEIHQRWVNHALAVGVVVTASVAADLGALVLLATRTQIQVMHRHQTAPLRGLEAVTNIGQGPVHDGAHGVREITVMQFALDLNIDEAICRWNGGFWCL